MCGHVGVYGKLPSTDNKKLMAFMLLLDSTRGTDGTGIYSLGEVNKVVGNVYNLIESRQWEKDVHESNLMIGHNRASSVGKNSTRNSHPFRFGKIIGAHNGTLQKYLLKDSNDFDVDSECLYHNIEKYGIKETAKNMSGSWSLVWYDEGEQVLRFLRNKERPMWIAHISETKENATTKVKTTHKAILWASEYWMLEAAENKYQFVIDEVYETEEDMLYEWMLDKGEPLLMNKEKLIGRLPLQTYYPTAYYGGKKRYKQYKSYRNEKEVKRPVYKCEFCFEEYDDPNEIEYGYNVMKNGKQERAYLCKNCAHDYNYMMY